MVLDYDRGVWNTALNPLSSEGRANKTPKTDPRLLEKGC